MIGSQNLVVSVYHCLMKIRVFDIPVVYKKELFTIGPPGVFWFPDKSLDGNQGSFRFKGEQIGIMRFSKNAYDALPQG